MTDINIAKLNEDIAGFPQVHPITADMEMVFEGVSRLVMLDRYAFKDTEKKTLTVGDFVVLTIKDDPQFPARGYGFVTDIDWLNNEVCVELNEQFRATAQADRIRITIAAIDKPLEVYYEQIARRNATGLAAVETDSNKQAEMFDKFYEELVALNFVPAGRVLYGAGSETDVTFFNCLAGETIVQTRQGSKAIRELSGEVEVLSMDGKYRTANFKTYGEQELFEVTFANGETVRATAGHEWFYNTKNGLKKTTTLELVGKRIPLERKSKEFADNEMRAGIIHGIVYGDGTVQDGEASVKLFGNKIELIRFFKGCKIVPHYNGDYVGVYGLNPQFKKLPTDVSESYYHGFMQGLIATDGYVDERGSFGLHSSDLSDLHEITTQLHKTNFAFSSIKMTRELSPFNGEYSPSYRLQLVKQSAEPTDFLRSEHRRSFENSPEANRKASIEVVSILPTGLTETVYCCEEPETNSFVIGTGYLTSNCYVMPYPKDSRGGIGEHRNEVMEIMSRGGGVGTNGSTLRPRNALARGVNGKSSGSVSWLNDIAQLTHLVEQGGSRRGAQMIMLADWHPDIIEFIISKMQNPAILRHIVATTKDEQIRKYAQDKLKFTPLSADEQAMLKSTNALIEATEEFGIEIPEEVLVDAKSSEKLLAEGGRYTVHNPEFLTGANISVALTREFMQAVEDDADYELRFPDVENYSEYDMALYDDHWHEVGDVREWEARGMVVKTYRTIKARDLWNLINVCATYSAEPGVFFIDNANDATNAQAYGQQVVATNPCFTGDMRLLTESGYKTFEELSPDGEVKSVRVINKDGVISDGSVWSSGIKDIVEVRLGNGSHITCTPDHVFMTNTGDEVEASDLKGHRVMPNLIEPKDFEIKFELFGFIQGDGQLTRLGNDSFRGLEVNVGEGDLEIRHLFRKHMNVSDYVDDRRIYVSGLNDELEELGFSSSALPERIMPKSYDSWDIAKKRSFIRGCYSANGSVINVGRVAYKTTCKEFADQLVKSLENDFGIRAYITTNKPKEVEFSNGTYLCKESYDVNIANFEGLQKFYNEIGFIHRYKTYKLRDILIEKALKVVNVVPTGEKRKVYDFNEPLTHWGVVEGVVVHNCGEQPLAPYSVCNLAAINLANMVDKDAKVVDYDKLRQTVTTGVRIMDNVIDATPYFLEANEKQAKGERRLGLGVMGLADLLIYCEDVYGSPEGNAIVDKVFETIATTAYRASIELAKEKGSFPFLVGDDSYIDEHLRRKSDFINSGFMRKMPDDIRHDIMQYGIRNSHLLTVAPTGSTGTMVGVSTGLEPYFSFKYYRSGRLGNFIEVNAKIVQEYLEANPDADPSNLPEWFVSAMELAPEQHVDVQCIIQRWVDSSLSKTVNAPKGYTVEQVQSVYERLYAGGAKGGTVYVDGSRDSQVLTLTNGNGEAEDVEDRPEKLRETKTYGTDLGDNCPVCREGVVVESGGCHTCDTCGTQLQCGL